MPLRLHNKSLKFSCLGSKLAKLWPKTGFFRWKIRQSLGSHRLNFDFFSKILFDLFSAIKDLSFGILKSIFGELLFFGSYKGMSQKYEFYRKLTLLIKKKKKIIFFLVRPNNMGIYCAHFNFQKKGQKKTI